MSFRTLIIVLLAVAAIAGCGRRGPLEPPGGDPAPATYAAPASDISPLDPGSVPDVPRQEQLNPPRRRFLLDFLL